MTGESGPKYCRYCGELLVQNKYERIDKFLKRTHCNVDHANKHMGRLRRRK